jgi:hypothetical protein
MIEVFAFWCGNIELLSESLTIYEHPFPIFFVDLEILRYQISEGHECGSDLIFLPSHSIYQLFFTNKGLV